MSSLAGFTYEYVPGKSARTLLLLHGTGGNERDMLPLGEQLDPEASLLSPRGNVSENGIARFFSRLAEGVFDREDLAHRTEELAGFVDAARKKHGIDELIGVGYSNGANILLHLICLHPTLLHAAALLRPMSAGLPDTVDH